MKISIIIPCFNEEKTLSKIVDKVLKFKSHEKEIIIVDDCSEDNTPQIINDLVSKFRIFEAGSVANADAQNDVENYLDLYSSGPLTKAEMLNRFAEGKSVDPNYAKNFKIKRMGKDKDDIFWAIGKIHGIENAGLCDLNQLKATGGDPMRVQEIIN